MWSYKKAVRPVFMALALVSGAATLSACSFTPLYGEQAALNLAYASPDSRLEQIIYQDLALRLGKTTTSDAPLVKITASTSSRRVGRTSSDSPATTYEATVTANVLVTKQETNASTGEIETKAIYTANRKASASYTTNDQRLANQHAVEEAQERAALAVAQTIRLLLAANLPGKL